MAWKNHRVENKQRLVYTTDDYIHQKENMLANTTLRLECKHFQSHRSPQRTPKLQSHYMHAMFSFVLPIKDTQYFAVNTRHIYNICKN